MGPADRNRKTIRIFNARTGLIDDVLPVVRSDEEWRSLLTPEQYEVARKKGTEYAFTGKYHACKEPGYTSAPAVVRISSIRPPSSTPVPDGQVFSPRFPNSTSACTAIFPAE